MHLEVQEFSKLGTMSYGMLCISRSEGTATASPLYHLCPLSCAMPFKCERKICHAALWIVEITVDFGEKWYTGHHCTHE